MAHDWLAWAEEQGEAIRAAGRWRSTRAFDALGPAGTLAGAQVVSFASNDYLGLSAHPDVVAAAHEALDRWGAGSTASRLVVGDRPVHDELEEELADWKGTEAALVFPTGFAANLGVLTTFAGPDVVVLSDELNHASIIDGVRMSRARVGIYRHCDVAHLEELIAGEDPDTAKLVVTDSVFSMDGDLAPVDEIAAVCARHGALLVLDEAHSVLGAAATGPDPSHAPVTIRVGTLSKALGALGGFAAGPRALVELLVNSARPFIFTTGSSPADTAAGLAGLRILRSAEGEELLARLRSVVDRVAPGHPSPIVPIVIGDEDDAMAAAAALLERGVFVPAIRPPTVAPGTSRLRVAMSAAHTDEMVDRLLAGLDELGLRG